MKDHPLERAVAQERSGRSTMWPAPSTQRCRSCRCVVPSPMGTLFQGAALGQIAYAMSCPSHYCRSRVVALAERDAFDEARALAAEAVYQRIGVI